MSERLERLQREIEAERQAVLEELGLSFNGPVLVAGDAADAARVIEARLARVPELVRDQARRRMQASALVMPWLKGRRVGGQSALNTA